MYFFALEFFRFRGRGAPNRGSPGVAVSGARWLRRHQNPGSSGDDFFAAFGGEVRRTAARPVGEGHHALRGAMVAPRSEPRFVRRAI